MMKLMTKEIERKLMKHPYGEDDGKGMESEVIVKYFNPYGYGTWLITQGEKQRNGDWLLYGYCHIYEWEWGIVMLSELEAFYLPPFGGIERDLHVRKQSKVKDLVYDGRVQ